LAISALISAGVSIFSEPFFGGVPFLAACCLRACRLRGVFANRNPDDIERARFAPTKALAAFLRPWFVRPRTLVDG
jgi:hypothetical protein